MTEQSLRSRDALLLVDVQNDVCAGGSLPVPDADAVVPLLNEWIAAAHDAGDIPVIACEETPAGMRTAGAVTEGNPCP